MPAANSGGGDPSPAVEAEPAAAAEMFVAAIDGARRYVALLSSAGLERGLIGPRERGKLWHRHVLNSAVIARLMPTGARIVDIGSGAGLPGIPVALARHDCRVDLVESLLRRTTFLSEVIGELGLEERCRVIRRRAEEAVGEVGGADAVTARAVAPLHKLARWGAPLLRPGGVFLAMKGRSAAEELERDRTVLRRCGLVDAEIVMVDAEPDISATVVRAIKKS